MKFGLFYEPAYWFLLEDLVRELEHEITLIGGQSCRLTTATLDQTDVDLVYVLPCDAQEKLKQLEAERLVINSIRAQEIAIDKIATSRLMVENNLPTPETVISQTPDAVVQMLERYGIALLKSTNLCGGVGHRILRCEEKSNYHTEARSDLSGRFWRTQPPPRSDTCACTALLRATVRRNDIPNQ